GEAKHKRATRPITRGDSEISGEHYEENISHWDFGDHNCFGWGVGSWPGELEAGRAKCVQARLCRLSKLTNRETGQQTGRHGSVESIFPEFCKPSALSWFGKGGSTGTGFCASDGGRCCCRFRL